MLPSPCPQMRPEHLLLDELATERVRGMASSDTKSCVPEHDVLVSVLLGNFFEHFQALLARFALITSKALYCSRVSRDVQRKETLSL